MSSLMNNRSEHLEKTISFAIKNTGITYHERSRSFGNASLLDIIPHLLKNRIKKFTILCCLK